MQVTSGKVVRIELDDELPEGLSVTVIADDDAFALGATTENMLRDAIALCDCGQALPLKAVAGGCSNRKGKRFSAQAGAGGRFGPATLGR